MTIPPAEEGKNTAPSASWSDLWQRFKTALIVGPPILFALYIGTWPFALVMMVAGGIIFFEWDRMSRKADADFVLWFGIGAIALCGFLAAAEQLTAAFVCLAVAFVLMCVFRRGRRNQLWMGFGLLYAGLPVIGLIQLRTIPEVGFLAVGWTLTTVWAGDTGAYGLGRALGGPKLIPMISPKKTWAGFFGGLAGAVLWSFGFYLVFGFSWAIGYVWSAIVAGLSGQVGDLFESWIKRHFGVKDSGGLFPGHGGIMDRADAVIMATALICILNAAGIGFVPAEGGASP